MFYFYLGRVGVVKPDLEALSYKKCNFDCTLRGFFSIIYCISSIRRWLSSYIPY